MTAKPLLIGELTAPHGVRGLMRLVSYAEPVEDIFSLTVTNAQGEKVKFEKRGVNKQSFIVAVDGVPDRDAADKTRKTKLYVDRAALPAAKGNEFYVTDLEGLTAKTAEGVVVGTIKHVLDYGAGPVLEIERAGQGNLLLLFTNAFVPTVDIKNGIITVIEPKEI